MIKALLLAASAALSVNAFDLPCPNSFLMVTLWDSFGDGWDTAYWRATDPLDNSATHQPTCSDAEMLPIFTCVSGDGNYSMEVSTADMTLPVGSWEIYWRVDVVSSVGEPTGVYLEGGYGTRMTWTYTSASDEWALAYVENEADTDCVACSGTKCSKSKSKSKAKKGGKVKHNGKGSPSSSASNSTSDEEDVYAYGSPNTNLKVEMNSPNGNGWNDVSPIGARWTISDMTNTEVFETGSLCKGNKGKCDVCLGDGTYIFRATSEVPVGNYSDETASVLDMDRSLLLKNGPKRGGRKGGSSDSNSTDSESVETVSSNSTADEKGKGKPKIGRGRHGKGGSSDSNSTADDLLKGGPKIGYEKNSTSSSSESNSTSGKSSPKTKGSPKARPAEDAWKFCHAAGSFGDQLTFHVKNGKCYPDDLSWAGENCDSFGQSTVTLSGVVSLEGIRSEIVNSRDYAVVLETLAATVSGWEMSSMQVTASSLQAQSLASAYTHQLEFTVSFIAEDFGVNGALYAAAEALANDMSATLQSSMTAGAFVQSLSSGALLAGSDSVKDVNAAQLVSLEIASIAYADNRLVYIYDSDSSSVSSSEPMLSASVLVLFVGVVAVAGIAVVGMIAHSYGSYQKVSTATDSEVSEKVWLSGMKSKFGVKFEQLPANSEQLEDGLRI